VWCLGDAFGYEGEELRSFEEMVVDFCETGGEGREFPVLSRVDVGHTDPMVTVPLNALAKLDSRENVWEILEPGVK
jgi:muramoyltetrapeptide carboxypeptidase LdcA involved in peptidoglycan recycling